MKYLYAFECDKRGLSTPEELQAAIDGNKREGRRSGGYGQYDSLPRSPNTSHLSSFSLVSPHQQLAARMNSVMAGGIGLHNGSVHPSHPLPMGQPLNGGPVGGLAPNEFETRMREYMKLFNSKDMDTSPASSVLIGSRQPSDEHQKEALNLSEPSLKREPERHESPPRKKFIKEEEMTKPVATNNTHITISSRGKFNAFKTIYQSATYYTKNLN